MTIYCIFILFRVRETKKRTSYDVRQQLEGEGFEPSKAEPTDLQSVPFGHSGTLPHSLSTDNSIYVKISFVKTF